MSTNLDIANRALGLIGQDRVVSLTPANTSGAAYPDKVVSTVNLFLQPALDETLRSRDWNCARKRAKLTLIPQVDVYNNSSLGEWRFAYALPTDYLTMRRIVNERHGYRSPWAIELHGDPGFEKYVFYTHWENVQVVYTARITVDKFDPLLVGACAKVLASQLAIAFSRDFKLAQGLASTAYQGIEEAVGTDEAEGNIEQETSTHFIDVRLGGTPDALGVDRPTNVIPEV